MKRKLLRTYLVVIFITFTITVLFSWNQVKDYFFNRVERESETKIVLLLDILLKEQEQGEVDFPEFVTIYSEKTGSRITIVNDRGEVIAESDHNVDDMDNHKNRVEISNVIKNNEVYTSFRYSNTMKGYYQYVAVPLKTDTFNGVLRIATPLHEVEDIILDMLTMIVIGILMGSIIAIIVAYIITNKLMIPIKELTHASMRIADGDYEEKIYISQKDEIGQLAEAFNGMTLKLKMNRWKLEHKNAELESILSSMGNGLIVIDPEYKIALYNEVFLNFLDIKEKDIKGKLFYEVTRNLVIFELIERSFEFNEMVVKEAKVSDASGNKVFFICANPIKSQMENGRNLGVLLTIQDVTQMRKLETMRSDFVSNVTHELKTPLTSIRGFVDTLKNGAMEDEQVALRFLDIIDIETERLAILIDDILILSEIEAMVGEKNVKAYRLGEIIHECVELLKPEAKSKNLDIMIEVDEKVSPYHCNKNRIKQMLINVIGNAIKYTDEGHIKVTLREEFKYAVIEVEDTGIGIEKKHISRLFERFYRVDKGRSRSMGGTGLGLSIVKHIAELYNGKIKVESKVGVGTKMTIRLPYSRE